MPEPLLQVLFVADQHVDILDDASQHLDARALAAGDVPELVAIVQVERDDRAGRFGRLHPFDNQLGRGLRERREDAAAVEPAHAAREDRLPVEVARLQLRRRPRWSGCRRPPGRARRGRDRCRRSPCSVRARRRA